MWRTGTHLLLLPPPPLRVGLHKIPPRARPVQLDSSVYLSTLKSHSYRHTILRISRQTGRRVCALGCSGLSAPRFLVVRPSISFLNRPTSPMPQDSDGACPWLPRRAPRCPFDTFPFASPSKKLLQAPFFPYNHLLITTSPPITLVVACTSLGPSFVFPKTGSLHVLSSYQSHHRSKKTAPKSTMSRKVGPYLRLLLFRTWLAMRIASFAKWCPGLLKGEWNALIAAWLSTPIAKGFHASPC